MNINEAFPSTYLKASDLQGKRVRVVIGGCELMDVGSQDSPDRKPVLYFEGKEKGLVLNKTNSHSISSVFGPETDGWVGKEIILRPDTTLFQGRSVDCIRIDVPRPEAGPDDEMPF